MRAHAHPTLPVRAVVGGVVITTPVRLVQIFRAYYGECPSEVPVRSSRAEKATRSGATQLVAPPLFRCFPGNSRSGWQTR